MTTISIEKLGLRFTARRMGERTDGTCVDVTRISDGRHVGQELFGSDFSTWTADLVEIAADYYIAKKLDVPEPEKTFCYACEAELTPDGNRDTDYQFNNALWVSLDGGYGMFVDDVESFGVMSKRKWSDKKHRAVICHDCAHKLCATVPWIEKLLNSWGSHSHRQDYHDANPDHYGWDYSRRAGELPDPDRSEAEERLASLRERSTGRREGLDEHDNSTS